MCYFIYRGARLESHNELTIFYTPHSVLRWLLVYLKYINTTFNVLMRKQFIMQVISLMVGTYLYIGIYRGYMIMVYNATINNISVISWRSVLLVEKTGVPGDNHRPVASH